MTYHLAKKTGCFNDFQARLIADATQGVDEVPDTDPSLGLTASQRSQNIYNHGLSQGSYEGRENQDLRRQSRNGRTNYIGLGSYLHYYQDSYSHAGYESSFIGHGYMGHYPDYTNSDVEKALRMADATFNALNDYAKEKCGCAGNTTYDKETIRRFAKVPAGSYALDITWFPHNLEKKRQILGVPER